MIDKNSLRLDVAPLEGVTGYIFRTVHHKYFPDVDQYYIPFIEPKPNSRKIFNAREYNDMLPEHNQGFTVIPQILTNKAEDFLWTAEHLMAYGYKEININLGCPSKTVSSKGRGSGFLAFPEALDRFLDTIFNGMAQLGGIVTIKTRIGKDSLEEFEQLLDIYNQYPAKELVIHPRTQAEFYKGTPHLEVFEQAEKKSKIPLVFNGNLFSKTDTEAFHATFPDVHACMFGRGLIANPGLIGEIRGKEPMSAKLLWDYYMELSDNYAEVLFGEKNVLFKLKEFWCYTITLFDDPTGKYVKAVKKANNLTTFNSALQSLMQNCPLDTSRGFIPKL